MPQFIFSYLEMWIKASFVLFTLIHWLPKTVPQSLDNFDTEAKECQHRYGLTDEEFEKVMKERALPKKEPIESRRCFAECILAAEKVLNDGKLDEDAVLKFMKEGFKEAGVTLDEVKIKKGISDCVIKSGTGKCTSGYNSWNCMMEFLSNYGTESGELEEAVEKKCKAKHNVDESIFIEGKSGYDEDVIILKDESNENHRCYVQCLMEGFGYIKDGELDQELVMREVLKDLEEKSVNAENEKLHDAIGLCAEKTGEGKCNRTYQIAKCFYSVTD